MKIQTIFIALVILLILIPLLVVFLSGVAYTAEGDGSGWVTAKCKYQNYPSRDCGTCECQGTVQHGTCWPGGGSPAGCWYGIQFTGFFKEFITIKLGEPKK